MLLLALTFVFLSCAIRFTLLPYFIDRQNRPAVVATAVMGILFSVMGIYWALAGLIALITTGSAEGMF